MIKNSMLHIRCIVKGCENHTDEGPFIGGMCMPCHTMITTGKVGPTTSFLGKMQKDIDELESSVIHKRQYNDQLIRTLQALEDDLIEYKLKEYTCTLSDVLPVRKEVYVAIAYCDNYERVCYRLFSTEEKAEAYKECVERVVDCTTVRIGKRFIDETKEETRARCNR